MIPSSEDERENRPTDPSNPFDEHSSEGSPDEAMDPNRLAALIEGRLSGHDREELVATIGPAEAAGVLSDAMVALAEVKGTPATNQARRRRWRLGVWLAVAACVAGVLLLPLASLRMHRPSNVGPEQYAAMLAAQGVRMPANWNDTPWDVARGPEELTPEARAFRIGVHLTDLGVAARRGDAAAATYTIAIASLVDEVPGASPVAAMYRAAIAPATHHAPAEPLLDSAIRATISLPDSTTIRLGAWLEAARLAAHAHDPVFFATSERPTAFGQATRSTLPADTFAEVEQLAHQAAESRQPDWANIEGMLTQIVRDRGR